MYDKHSMKDYKKSKINRWLGVDQESFDLIENYFNDFINEDDLNQSIEISDPKKVINFDD